MVTSGRWAAPPSARAVRLLRTPRILRRGARAGHRIATIPGFSGAKPAKPRSIQIRPGK
jgi:hypothetical protein